MHLRTTPSTEHDPLKESLPFARRTTTLEAIPRSAPPRRGAASGKKASRPGAGVSAVAPSRDPDKSLVFKKTRQGELKLFFYLRKDWKPDDRRPAIVFWSAGGFVTGTPAQFYHFAGRGVVCVCAEYRIKSLHCTGIDKCFEDARSAMRWLKEHARELGVDPAKVIASGGSAGGTLSLPVSLASEPDSPDDDLNISPEPCAMVLFNPAQGEAVASRVQGSKAEKAPMLKAVSALNTPQEDQPPAILFFGSDEPLLPASRTFCEKSLALGAPCQLWTAAGATHGFSNRQPWHDATLRKADEFLTALGYLQGPPTIGARPDAELKLELPGKQPQ